MTPDRIAEITERQQYASGLVDGFQLPPSMYGPMDGNIARYAADVGELLTERAILLAALNRIASWGEGDVVTGAFDDPASAKIARDALAGRA